MKVLLGKIGHETNTFSAQKTDFDNWAQAGWYTGEDFIRELDGKTDYNSGMMAAAKELGVEIVPTVSILNAGALIEKDAYDYVLGRFLEYVRASKEDLDGICLALHGAGCVEGIDDMETDILKAVRRIVGEEIPVTMTLDLHANMTDDMVALCNGIFGIKQYPHTDMEVTGKLAMEQLVRQLKGETKLYTALVKLPLLIAPGFGNTYGGPMKEISDYSCRFREVKGLVDATIFHGFPFADRAESGASVLTVSDVSQEHADATAKELAGYLWQNRKNIIQESLSGKEAVDRAIAKLKEPGEGYVVINETSDNPGGGTPCDGTGLLRELLTRKDVKSILGYIHDEEVALMAHEAGLGAKISGLLGAKTDKLHGTPIEFEDAVVAGLSDGNCIYNTPMNLGQKICYGKTARLVMGNVEVVVTEKLAQQAFDDVIFTTVGADPSEYDIVGVKSSNHFRAWFEPRAKAIVTADTPGIHTCNLKSLPFKNIKRPIFPLDSQSGEVMGFGDFSITDVKLKK